MSFIILSRQEFDWLAKGAVVVIVLSIAGLIYTYKTSK